LGGDSASKVEVIDLKGGRFQERTMTSISPTSKLAVLVGLTMLSWSLLFATTYGYSFFWDDLHFIRAYSSAELLSTFHGPNDPDGIETAALRPIMMLLFCFEGTIFGENVVLLRVFMAVLMGVLLWVVGLLLRRVGLSFRHIAVVFVLFASSKVFASLMLWMTLGAQILCYIFMTLTALFYLRWVDGEATPVLVLTLGFTALAISTREQAYTLPVVLPLLWCIVSPRRTNWRRAVVGVLGVTVILAIHFMLRRIFVPNAPSIWPSLGGTFSLLRSVRSAWMPSGYDVPGHGDQLLSWLWLLWQGFLSVLFLAFLRISSNRSFVQFFGVCVLGVVLCTSALVAPRSFDIALPALAFFTAISLAIFEVHQFSSTIPYRQSSWRPAVLGILVLGVALGVVGGIRGSQYIADALHDNSVRKVISDGHFLFDFYPKPASIPARRRAAGLARLAALGIRSSEDLRRLERDVKESPDQFIRNRDAKSALFLPKYGFGTF